MLKNTFCHLPDIGISTEHQIWESGIYTWDDLGMGQIKLPQINIFDLYDLLMESQENIDKINPNYFSELLPISQHWRLFKDFRNHVVYLDIETTGLNHFRNYITTIALYDGERIRYYIKGKNLNDFREDIQRYKVLVTYNGKCFDVPFLRRHLKLKLNQAHIDLRFVLRSLGYSGGLKSCEQKLGICRGNLDPVDGYMAVGLWHQYNKTKDRKSLDTLLAYNIEDVLTLEKLMVFAYNEKIKETCPFGKRACN